MFVINPASNSITSLNRKTFSELGFKEKAHLQEWIAGNPEALGEKLLIIQKEFSDFIDTNERLDLLALDKNGNLVVIENKLDDSGRDVTWQALKYASYCSTLTKEEIRNIFQNYLDSYSPGKNAVDVLEEFFDNAEYSEIVLNQRMTQRIILVAANFRKEVTSTVLWLMNFKIQIQCFKATPYELNGQYFLTLEQIIPTKDAQDYVISMTRKAQEEVTTGEELKSRHRIRLRFWAEFLKQIKGKSPLFQNSTNTKDNTLYAGGTGITYVTYQVAISSSNSSVSLNFGRSTAEENKTLFDALYKHAADIDKAFGDHLSWERNDDLKKSSVSYYKQGQNYFNEEEWPSIIAFLIEHINKLEKAVKPYLSEIRAALKANVTHINEPIEEEQQ
jgi:hypothetical protein